MADGQDKVASWGRVILLAILTFFALGLVLPGAAVYLTVVDEWARNPRGFYGIEGAIGWIFGMFAAAAIALSFVLAGIILRIVAWRQARFGSLCLTILSTAFVIVTYFVFSDTNGGPGSIEMFFVQGSAILFLIVAALPPFLHWAMARPTTPPSPKEPST